jgi:hypothetical protein
MLLIESRDLRDVRYEQDDPTDTGSHGVILQSVESAGRLSFPAPVAILPMRGFGL